MVSAPKQRAGGMGDFRMYVLRFESGPPDHCWEIPKDTPVTDDVVECEDRGRVEVSLAKVFEVPVSPVGDGCGCH